MSELMIEFECPACRKTLSVDSLAAGQSGTCPECGRGITVPAPPTSKDCPFCGETILAVARKCKHCGELQPGFRPAAEKPLGENTVIGAYFLAVLMPLFGIIGGIYLMCRKAHGNGLGVILLSLLALGGWAKLLIH